MSATKERQSGSEGEDCGLTADRLLDRALEAVRDCYAIMELTQQQQRNVSDAAMLLRRVLNERAGRDSDAMWPPERESNGEWRDEDRVTLTPRGMAVGESLNDK